jgi:phage-related protein
MGDSRKQIHGFPAEVRWEIGGAIDSAENGESHVSASPMRGINAIEVVSDHDGDTYRCMYTTKFKGHVYVLHAFKKKSTSGIKTPKREIDLIEKRLKDAKAHHEEFRTAQRRRLADTH